MKRIIIWVDVKGKECEQILEKLKESLNSLGIEYSIVDVHDIVKLGDTK